MRSIAVVFLKASCGTRLAVAVAAADEGANVEILAREEIRFGKKESVRDAARVLGRVFDGIAFRGFDHPILVELSKNAGVPVWNCLCDQYPPPQVLADFMTIRAECGRLADVRMAYVGDGRNNMARSLVIGAVKLGVDLRIVAPTPLQLDFESLSLVYSPAPGETGRVRTTSGLRPRFLLRRGYACTECTRRASPQRASSRSAVASSAAARSPFAPELSMA